MPETAALQMRLSVMAGLNAKLAEVTKSWQEMRVQWHEEDREEVALQLHTVTGRDYAPEEVEQLVQSGGAETIYRQALSTISGASVRLLGGPLRSLTWWQKSAIALEASLGLIFPLDCPSQDTKSDRARGKGKTLLWHLRWDRNLLVEVLAPHIWQASIEGAGWRCRCNRQ